MSKTEIDNKNISFYLRGRDSGEFTAAVAYCVRDENIYGAFYGYAGGGEYDGGFFEVDQSDWNVRILGYDEAEGSDDSELFTELMALCGSMSDDEDSSMLSKEGLELLESGEQDEDDERVVILNNFDGDSLSDISEKWNISLRFES